MAYKGTETDVLYGVAMDRAVMAYKGTETTEERYTDDDSL
jgi:hypothetical protein